MSRPTPQALDGLWRCLRPSIDAAFLSRASARLPSLSSAPHSHGRHRQYGPLGQTRRYQTVEATEAPHGQHINRSTEPVTTQRRTEESSETNAGRPGYLSNRPTPLLLQQLRESMKSQNQAGRIRAIVRHLCEDRGMKMDSLMLEALVVANWDPTGSAAELRLILHKLAQEDISPDSAFYHAALRLLAIHPDYLTRRRILQGMKYRGIPITTEGRLSVALGLLRDGQDEMALDYLEQMVRDAVEIPVWVADIFIFVLGKKGFVEEALWVMQHARPTKTPNGDDIPSALMWYFLLDISSSAYYYRGTKHIWDNQIQSPQPIPIHPSDGILTTILETAARHGDIDLATSVIQTLSRRSIKLTRQHYESLIACYLPTSLSSALRVLAIMKRAGLPNLLTSTSELRHALRTAPNPSTHPSLLTTLSSTSDLTPEAELLVLDALCFHGELTLAARLLSSRPPSADDTPLYDTLLSSISLIQNPTPADAKTILSATESRFFLTSSTSPKAAERYGHLLLCYTISGDLDSAFTCLERIQAAGRMKGVPVGYLLQLLTRALEKRDPRAWDLFERVDPLGMVQDEEGEEVRVLLGEVRRRVKALGVERDVLAGEVEGEDGGKKEGEWVTPGSFKEQLFKRSS